MIIPGRKGPYSFGYFISLLLVIRPFSEPKPMSKKPVFKRYTVTSALPYANGPIHIGHLAGVYVPAATQISSDGAATARAS